MSKDSVIDSLGRIDDDMIQVVETLRRKKKRPPWMKWGTLAVCLCLAVVSVYVVPRITNPSPSDSPAPDPDGTIQREDEPDIYPNHPILKPGDKGYINPNMENTEETRISWTVHFNEASSVLMANRPNIKGVFTETLNNTELAALKPNKWLEDMTCFGYARFDNYGNLLDVVMQITTTLAESPVTVALADYYFGFDYVLPGEEVVSVCNEVEYRVYQYQAGNTVTLSARTIINDIYFDFAMDTTPAQLEQAKADFRRVLECFACYEDDKPDLSLIVPKEIPEMTEYIFTTLAEAQAEPDFGQYMPSELPAGFEEDAIRRFKFQNSNFLSGMWSRGLENLSWVVTSFTEEDAHRLTDVEDKTNYDLTLYPIPRARSVPDELRETVDNPIFKAEELTLEAVYCRAYQVNDEGDTDGWRMKFSVKYGDVIISVSSKGVEPEWLYQQLVKLVSE